MHSEEKPNNHKKDELGRRPFAEAIAQDLIKARQAEQSQEEQDKCHIIGLEGTWGSGKTYTKDLIKEHLSQRVKQGEVIWHEFNPWIFHDHEHLASIFLTDLANKLYPPSPLKTSLKRRMSNLLKLSATLTRAVTFSIFICCIIFVLLSVVVFLANQFQEIDLPLWLEDLSQKTSYSLASIISFFTALSIGYKAFTAPVSSLEKASYKLEEYAAYIDSNGFERQLSHAEKIKEEVGKLLGEGLGKKRVIVVIEDLDRLTPSEIRTMVQLVRSVADFPKLSYLVPYDREQVICALGEFSASEDTRRGYGEGYLRKVIPIAHRLPEPPESAIEKLLYSRFDDYAKLYFDGNYQEHPYWQAIWPKLHIHWRTIRDGEQVLDRARTMAFLINEKSNPADILVAAHLMTHENQLWEWLWDNRTDMLSGWEMLREENKKWELLQRKISFSENREKTSELLEIVFPTISNNTFIPLVNRKYALGSMDYIANYYRYSNPDEKDIIEYVYDTLKKNSLELKSYIQEFSSNSPDRVEHYIQVIKQEILLNPHSYQLSPLELLKSLGEVFDNHKLHPNAHREVYSFAKEWLARSGRQEWAKNFYKLTSYWLESSNILLLPIMLLDDADKKGNLRMTGDKTGISLSDDQIQQIMDKLHWRMDCLTSDSSDVSVLDWNWALAIIFCWKRLLPEQAKHKIQSWLNDDWRIFDLLDVFILKYDIETEKENTINISHLEGATEKSLPQIKELLLKAQAKSPNAAKGHERTIAIIEELPQ